jgi:Flp pilus assembly pilin Flp
MRSERGQATVEWIALLLLVALVLVAAGHLASRANGRELGATLAHSVTHPGRQSRTAERSGRAHPARFPVLPKSARADSLDALRRAAPDALRRAGRGAGVLWRRAWFACLVYERTRYVFRHPESQQPGYTLPYGVALRMINGCVSPVDLLDDIPGLDSGS